MDPFYEGVSLFGEFSHQKVHMILARKRTKRILAFGKRDFVFLSVKDEPLQDGTWVSGTVSVQTPKIPRQEGYTRAFQDSIAFYKPTGKDKTHLTIVCRIDLNDSSEDGSGGWMPMWLYVKTIGATGARSVFSMRNVLEKEQQERLLWEEEDEQRHEERHEATKERFPFWKRKKASDNTSLASQTVGWSWRDRGEESQRQDHKNRWLLPRMSGPRKIKKEDEKVIPRDKRRSGGSPGITFRKEAPIVEPAAVRWGSKVQRWFKRL
jgi:hypothetical protein